MSSPASERAQLWQRLLPDAVATSLVASRNAASTAGVRIAGHDAVTAVGAAALWRELARIGSVRTGRIDAGGAFATVGLDHADVDAERQVRAEWTFHLPTGAPLESPPPPSFGASAGTAVAPPVFWSPSGRRSVRFLSASTSDGGDSASAIAELWERNGPVTRVAVKHQAVLVDALFQSVQWTRCESRIVYVAEVAPPKTFKFFNVSGKPLPEGPTGTDAGVFAGKDTWGEGLSKHSSLGLFYVDFSARVTTALLSPSFSLATTAVSPVVVEPQTAASSPTANNFSVYFVGIPHGAHRLGLLHCVARPNALYHIRVDAARIVEAAAAAAAISTSSSQQSPLLGSLADTFGSGPERVALPDTVRNVASPQFNEASGLIAFVSSACQRSHHSGTSLWTFRPPREFPQEEGISTAATTAAAPALEARRIVAPVDTDGGDPSVFPGLYSFPIFLQWAGPDLLLVGSVRRSRRTLYFVTPSAGTIREVVLHATDTAAGGRRVFRSVTVLAFRPEHGALVADGSFTRGPQVWWLPSSGFDAESGVAGGARLLLSLVDAFPAYVARAMPLMYTRVRGFPDLHNSEVLIHSIGSTAAAAHGWKRRGTVIFLHGGPHAQDASVFYPSLMLLLLRGFQVVSVNYGGSVGFGQRHLEDLPGNIGRADVSDVLGCIDALRQRGSAYDNGDTEGCAPSSDQDEAVLLPGEPLFVHGGSHGGYLVAHLTGQRPHLFAAAAMRNPVIALQASLLESDIPDWVLYEVGLDEGWLRPEGAALQPAQTGADTGSTAGAPLLPPLEVGEASDAMMLHAASPLRFANAVRTPTLIGLGLADLRVPCVQGRAWYRALRRAGHAEVTLMEYPTDGHDMASVAASGDFALHALLHFERYAREW